MQWHLLTASTLLAPPLYFVTASSLSPTPLSPPIIIFTTVREEEEEEEEVPIVSPIRLESLRIHKIHRTFTQIQSRSLSPARPRPISRSPSFFFVFPSKTLIFGVRVQSMKGTGQWFTVGLVSAWYTSNIGVLLLNKYLLSNYGFRYPIFLTMCHMTACSLLSYVAIVWMKMVPLQAVRSRVQLMKISALSFIFCMSVVSGNVSLKYIPVSFNQAIGATTPFFTAVFAYLMTVKREAWFTYVTLIPVVAGVIIASGGEPSFHLFGFTICVAATAARALKSVVQGILLSSEGEKLNSMNLLLYMSPIAVVILLPATLLMEDNVVGITIAHAREDINIIWYLLFNSSLAYLVNLTNFLVTKHTSALTLQVLGNAKGAVAVVVSILIFRNPVSVTGMAGYLLTVMGVVLYSEAKKRSKQGSS